MRKAKSFSVLFHYLREDKLKIFVYIVLVLLTYLPTLVSAYFWGRAIEQLLAKDIYGFVFFFGSWELIHIVCFTILLVPRDKLYNYLEIKFMNNVSKDLYMKIDNLPAIAFEDIGVGEFVNRLSSDTDRVMSLLNNLIRLVCKAFVVIVVLMLSFYISWILGLEIVIFGIVMGGISYKFFPKIKKTQESVKKETDEYVKTATENFTGIREIKSLGIKKNTEITLISTGTLLILPFTSIFLFSLKKSI